MYNDKLLDVLELGGYIRRENGGRPALYDRYDEFVCRVPVATMHRLANTKTKCWGNKLHLWMTRDGEQYLTTYTARVYSEHENRERCITVADEIEAYADGNMYRCPDCGEFLNITSDRYRCPACGCVADLDEFEQLSMYDYLIENGLDIEYRIGADKEYRSCEIMVAWGGPNIYIDTASDTVKLYWGGEKAVYYIPGSVSDEIDDACEEQYNCL